MSPSTQSKAVLRPRQVQRLATSLSSSRPGRRLSCPNRRSSDSAGSRADACGQLRIRPPKGRARELVDPSLRAIHLAREAGQTGSGMAWSSSPARSTTWSVTCSKSDRTLIDLSGVLVCLWVQYRCRADARGFWLSAPRLERSVSVSTSCVPCFSPQRPADCQLGFAIGPMLLAPLSEYFGTTSGLFISWFIFTVFQLPVSPERV